MDPPVDLTRGQNNISHRHSGLRVEACNFFRVIVTTRCHSYMWLLCLLHARQRSIFTCKLT